MLLISGSMYCDNVLRARGFTGEFIRGSSSIAVKVHGIKGLFTNGNLPQRIFNRTPIFGAAILLVRDPKSALVAEWHRERTKRQTNATSSNHYLSAGEEFFSKFTILMLITIRRSQSGAYPLFISCDYGSGEIISFVEGL